MLKILLIHQYYLEADDAGGSRWNEITRQWVSKGHQVTVLAGMVHAHGNGKRPEYKGRYFYRKEQGGVQILRCHVSESYNANFFGRLWGYFSFMFSSLWGGLFKTKDKYDLVLVTSPPLFVGITGIIISKLKRIPLVFEIRDLWPESAIDTGVLKSPIIIKLAFWIEKLIYRNARLINVLTPAFRDTLINKKGIDPKKIIFIPNAADFQLSDRLLQEFDSELFRKEKGLSGKFVLTYVGAHGVANHLEQLFDVAAQLKNTNVLFLMIGQGMEKARLKEVANKRGLTNVLFLDPVPKAEVFKYILASDMGLSVLKKVDTFKTVYSNKTFDYMSCQRPILMAIDGVSRELVETANAGSYVEPENTEEYVRIIKDYLVHPEKLKLEGMNGFVYAKQNFDRTILADKYITYLETMVSDPS